MVDSVKLRLANFPGLGNFGSMASLRAYEPIGKMLREERRFAGHEVWRGRRSDARFHRRGYCRRGGRPRHHFQDAGPGAVGRERTAAATGLSTDQVQEFTEIAKEMNLDAGSLESAFARINSQLGEFVATGSATSWDRSSSSKC